MNETVRSTVDADMGHGGRATAAVAGCGAVRSAPRSWPCSPRAPGHGYEVMQRLEEKSGGAWRPSPGSVYPTLQLLEDEGLVRSTERDGKRVYELTDEGRAEATRRTEEAGGDPFAADRVASVYGQLRENGMSLLQAIRQIARTGNEAQVQQASEIVRDARKQLYRLLADD